MSLTRGQFVGVALWAGALRADPAAGQPSGFDQVERLLAFEHRLEAAYNAALGRGAIAEADAVSGTRASPPTHESV